MMPWIRRPAASPMPMFNLRIGPRLIVGAVVMIGLIVTVGAVALRGVAATRDRYDRALEEYAARAHAGLQLEVAVLEQVRLQKNYLVRGDDASLEQAQAQVRAVAAARSRLGAPESADARALRSQLDGALNALEHDFRRGAQVRTTAGIAAADQLTRGRAVAAVALLDRLVAADLAMEQRERAGALALARRTRTLTIALIILTSLIALAVGVALAISVTRPLGRLQSQVTAVTAGAMPSEPAVTGRDEVAQIARAFYEMVQKASLLRETEVRSRRLEALSSRVARAQEEERERIAHELHDGLGQALTAIRLDLSAAARNLGPEAGAAKTQLAKAQRLTDESLDELRAMVFDLRPPALDNLGLVAAIESHIRAFTERTGIAVDLNADEGERLAFEVETALYRICQEALTNIAKHSRATRATVRLARDAERITLTVTDNGEGFDLAAVTEADGTPTGVGLLGMERRAEELGGALKIETARGRGTTVQASVPPLPSRRT